jgi:hypothetical protein
MGIRFRCSSAGTDLLTGCGVASGARESVPLLPGADAEQSPQGRLGGFGEGLSWTARVRLRGLESRHPADARQG